jgi:hypothetical protein
MEEKTFEGFDFTKTTAVPDVLFDMLLAELSSAEMKVLLYIIRRTRGFQKVMDAISLSQLQKGITKKDGTIQDKGCGINRRETICNALASLEAKKYIYSKKQKTDRNEHVTTIYGLCAQQVVAKPDHKTMADDAKTEPPVVSDANHRSPVQASGVVAKPNPQETVLQDTDKQETDIQEVRKGVAPATDKQATLPSEKKENVSSSQPTISNTSSKNNDPQIEEMPPNAKAVWDAWCSNSWFRGVTPPLTAKAIEQCKTQAQYELTKEQMDEVRVWATSAKVDKSKYFVGKPWLLGDLVRETPKWLSAQNRTSKPPVVHLPQPNNQQEDHNPMVLWTCEPDHPLDAESYWWLYELMPLSVAKQHKFDEYGGSLARNVELTILQRQDEERRGLRTRPQLVAIA